MLSVARHRRLLVLTSVLVAFGPGASLAMAQNDPEPRAREQRPQQRADQQDRSLSDAVRHVQRTTGGRILGAERVPYDGRDINRVKYMDDRGRVRYMDDPSPSRRNADARAAAVDATPRHPNP